MIKPIKFDLKLSNGTKLATFDDLEENLSPALFEHFHSGKLAKWLRVRKLDELADKMETLQTEYLEYKNELDVQLFKKLCEVFVSEVDLDDAREAIAEFHALPVVQIENTEEIEESKNLMVIEQPKTKEFKVNERLLYKTFKDSHQYTFARGEIPTVGMIVNLERLNISIDDVLLYFCKGKYSIGFQGFILTNDCLFMSTLNDEYLYKIHLKDIYYMSYFFNTSDKFDSWVINQRRFISDPDKSYCTNYAALHEFLIDYLSLEHQDNFEQIDGVSIYQLSI